MGEAFVNPDGRSYERVSAVHPGMKAETAESVWPDLNVHGGAEALASFKPRPDASEP